MLSSATVAHPPRSYVRVGVLSLGEACVGKSCLIKRYCEKKFVAKYISTIGVDFGVRAVRAQASAAQNQGPAETKVNFWDLSGSPDFFAVRSEFHSHAQGVMLVYDVTRADTFAALSGWLREHSAHGGRPVMVAVCANKVDGEAPRVVSEAEGRAWARGQGFAYFETSAKSGQNVDEMFDAILQGIAKATHYQPKDK